MARIPQLYKEKDLEKIRTARDMFVHGVSNADGELEFPAIASLASVAGVSKQTLYKIADREDWKTDRVKVQVAIRSKRDADHAALAVREGKACDELCIKVAKKMLREVDRRMDEVITGFDSDGKMMKSATMQRLSIVVTNAHKTIKLAIGEPTEINGDFKDDETIRAFARMLDEHEESRTAISGNVNPKVDPTITTDPDSTT